MVKLVYPNDGIYKYCRNDIDNCLSNLKNAISNCSFDIPYNFSQKNYLDNLDNVLNKYCDKVKDIEFKLRKTDNDFENLSLELVSSSKKIEIKKIAKRDRMII